MNSVFPFSDMHGPRFFTFLPYMTLAAFEADVQPSSSAALGPAMQLSGIHHLTAVSADAPGNVKFYTKLLGLRLVKKTVNQDDVSAYHLFYADGLASPGSDITFFDFPALPESHGNNSITRVGMRVSGEASLQWWRDRLSKAAVSVGDIVERDGRHTLDVTDPEGQRLSLVDDGGKGQAHPWDKSPVPAEHQIRGLGPVVMTVPDLAPTDLLLTHVMNMRPVRDYAYPESNSDRVHVYAMNGEGPAAELHVAVRPDLPAAQPGAGGVHHVAFRSPDTDYDYWADRLRSMRIPNSGKVDRYWFHSLYFREPNGVLFEIATDGPGFAVDEPLDKLGETLVLPPFLEPRRRQIEAGLKPL
jgi:glyoxalase family protein